MAFIEPSLLTWTITASDKRHAKNCNVVRGAVREMIQERKASLAKDHGNLGDLISVLLTDEYYSVNEERIIDEVLTLFAAGSQTVQMASANLFAYISMDHSVRDKLV